MSVHSQTTLLQVDMYECCFPQGYTLCYNCRWQSDDQVFHHKHVGHWLCHLELRMVQLHVELKKKKQGKTKRWSSNPMCKGGQNILLPKTPPLPLTAVPIGIALFKWCHTYRMARKFGRESHLVDWRLGEQNCQILCPRYWTGFQSIHALDINRSTSSITCKASVD